jgi:hypothetical protein
MMLNMLCFSIMRSFGHLQDKSLKLQFKIKLTEAETDTGCADMAQCSDCATGALLAVGEAV